MGRELVVEFQGAVSRFGLARISRERLYGKKQRLIVDEDGAPCVAATLTRDGAALLPPGSTADLYIDDAFDVVERDELEAVGPDGVPLERVSSTLNVEQPLSGPVAPERVLDHVTTAVYALDPSELDDALAARLYAGEIFETRFAYRDGYSLSTVFLVANDDGPFALVSRPAVFEPLHREALPDPTGDDDDPFDDDDLDFSMF